MSGYESLSKQELISRLQKLETDFATSSPGQDAAERLKAILDTAVEGIITIDERGIIESINRAAENIFGYSAAEVIGRNVSVLMPRPDADRHDSYISNYLRSGHARIIGVGREVVGLRKCGSTFPMDLSVSEVRLADRRLFTGFVRDITERKKAELKLAQAAKTLEEKNKELETIVYVASHDLRSPLVNIQGFSKELSRACHALHQRLSTSRADLQDAGVMTLIHEEIPEALAYIQAGVTKIDLLLSGLLRFSRLGRAALRIERLNMNSMLAAIARSMEFQLQQAAVKLDLQPLPDCSGDAVQINQVFSNLLENALKYLVPGRPGEITVSGHIDGDHAVYEVKDNGRGIAPEHQHKIFEMFHRLHPDLAEGEGLGLTIALKIIERHQGRLWVQSSPGNGSSFFVRLSAFSELIN